MALEHTNEYIKTTSQLQFRPLQHIDIPLNLESLLSQTLHLNDPSRCYSLLSNKYCQAAYVGQGNDTGQISVLILHIGYPQYVGTSQPQFSVFVARSKPTWQPQDPNAQHPQHVNDSVRHQDINLATSDAYALEEGEETLWRWAAWFFSHQLRLSVMEFIFLPASVPFIFDAVLKEAGYNQTYTECRWRFMSNKQSPMADALLKSIPATIDAPCWDDASKVVPHRILLGPLLPQDASIVNDTWLRKNDTSLEMIKELIANHITSCVRLIPLGGTHQPESVPPATWILQQMDGSSGMAHTLPVYRRLSLSSVCIAYLVQQVLASGKQTEMFNSVVQTNIASTNMMLHKLGFKIAGCGYWLGYSKAEAGPMHSRL